MKRKVRMKRFKIGFSLLMSFVMIFGVLQYALTAKQQPVQAAADITTSNYKTWTAPTLEEARTTIKNFLEPKKGSDTARPYKDNRTWQEGSLAALDKVYYAAIEPDAGISSDLARQQLVQTVQGLELYDSKAYNARNIALNDYPNDELSYNMAQIMNGIEDASQNTYLSTMIFTDNSSNLSELIPGMQIKSISKTSFVYIRDSIQSYLLSRSSTLLTGIDPYYNQNGVIGFFSGAPKTSAGGTTVNLPVTDLNIRNQGENVAKDALFNGTTKDMPYYTWLQNTNPVYATSGVTSNPAAYVRWVSTIFNGKDRDAYWYGGYGAYRYYDTARYTVRPVLIMHSSYEFPSEDMKQDFLKSLDEFEHDALRQETYNTGPPIFIQISYKRPGGAANYDPMVDKIFTPARIAQGWRHLEVNSENAGTPDDLVKRITALDVYPRKVQNRKSGVVGYLDPEGSLQVDDPAHFHPIAEQTASEKLAWNSVLSTNLFDFVPNTFGSSIANQNSITANELKFSGAINGGLTSFDLTGKDQTYSSYKMGDKAPAYTKAELDYSGSPGSYNSSPNLYVPLSDAAVELYTYSGTGSETAASSYKLKNTIVSNTYDNYEGTSYSLKSSQLASKKYGTVLSQTDLKNAVKEAMGDSAYNSLNFTNSDSLNASSLTVKFDASKNVYKLYAKEVPTTSTITIEHWIKDGGKIATSTQADIQKTGNIGDLANITPTVISGYTYVNSDSDPLGQVKYDATSKTVRLYYTENPKTSTITIEHWISGGGKITTQSDLSKSGTSGQPANITPTAIDGYTYVNSDSDPLSSVTFGDTNRTVKLYYTENPKISTMKVKYLVAGSNDVIIPEKTIEGTNGESPTAAQLNKEAVGEGYTYLMQNPSTAKFGTDSEVILFYLVANGKITVEYWDKDANQMITSEGTQTLNGQVGTTPSITPKTIAGYNYDSATINQVTVNLSTIKFTTADQTVRLLYTKKQSTVNVKYVDEDTMDEIRPMLPMTGAVGSKPTIDKPAITDYQFTKSNPTDLSTVTFVDGEVTTVTLYYKKVPKNITLTIKFVDAAGDDLKESITKTQLSGEEIDIAAMPDVAKVIEDLQKLYVLTESPANPYKVPETNATVYFKFKGALKLVSVPDNLEFGTHNAQIFGEVEVSNPEYDPQTPLVVSDTRAPIAGWTLYAKVTKEMTALDDASDVLTDSLYYKMDDQEKPLGLNLSKSIYKPTTLKSGQYNVSQLEWENKNNGFVFKLPREQRRSMKDYQAVIQYTLSDAY